MRLTLVILVVSAVLLAGCTTPDSSDYRDAPEEIQDGQLDYQDYKEAGCPHLDGALDHEDMEKCNQWIRNQSNETETPV